MQVRLGFSIAIKVQGDILVLDEVLAVGDESFQRKCNNFFAKIKRNCCNALFKFFLLAFDQRFAEWPVLGYLLNDCN